MCDLLHDFIDFIDDTSEYDPFDPAIIQLPEIERVLTDLLHKVRLRIDQAVTERKKSYSSARSSAPIQLPSAPPLDTNWIVVRRRGKYPAHRREQILPPPPRVPSETEIPLTHNISLRCIEIQDATMVNTDGVLYYIPRIRRFAIRIAGFVLYGNLGIIYGSDPKPQRIRDCASGAACRSRDCRYYHNPLMIAGSDDIRNFSASSWTYYPGGSAHQLSREKSQQKKRKLASLDRLDDDIKTITPDDLVYYNEQMMHDLLCCIVMNHYIRIPHYPGLLHGGR